MLKKYLMENSARVRPKYGEYYIDEMTKEMGHRVLLLPLYHCELNSIEILPAGFDSVTARR
jgi:hypothetical protein